MNVEKIKRILLITIGVMTAIMGYYIWLYNMEKKAVKPEPIRDVTDADVVVNNFEVVETFNDRVLWILHAKVAEVYSSRKETRLKDVEVDFFDENGKSMHLISDYGVKDDQTGNIIASGNVQATAIQEGSILKTEELIYNAETRKITSEKHVIIEKGAMITEGDGLESDLHLTETKVLRNIMTFFILTE
jgi:LPS export ABC transporter protein LptC